MAFFSIGFVNATTEFHVLDYGIEEKYVGYWYSIVSLAYFISSILGILFTNYFNKINLMAFGCVLLGCGYLLFGPCPFLFSTSLLLTGIGLFLIGIACRFMFIPSMPHMIEVANGEYGYIDNRINDTLSALSNFSICLGLILGPIFSNFFYDLIGYAYAATMLAFIVFGYSLVYFYFSKKLKTIKHIV